MKSELRIADHSILPGAKVFEIWYRGEFIGQVVGADGPGVRVVSKYDMEAKVDNPHMSPAVTEVKIKF